MVTVTCHTSISGARMAYDYEVVYENEIVRSLAGLRCRIRWEIRYEIAYEEYMMMRSTNVSWIHYPWPYRLVNCVVWGVSYAMRCSYIHLSWAWQWWMTMLAERWNKKCLKAIDRWTKPVQGPPDRNEKRDQRRCWSVKLITEECLRPGKKQVFVIAATYLTKKEHGRVNSAL